MDERLAKLSDLLHEAAETHHVVYRITEGTDPDWATWYADWLVKLSELPTILGVEVVRSELTYLLVKMDRDQREQAPGQKWEDLYARGLIENFSG
jgi:hypothetical protein